MKYLIYILLFTAFSYPQTPPAQFTMWDNPIGGLNTTKLPQNLSPYQFQQLNNVYTDDDNGIKQSQGLLSIWASTDNIRFHKEYTKTDGSRYLMFVASNTLNYATTGGSYTTLLSTISLTGTIWGTQYNNRFYLGDSDGDSWYFDGTSLYTSTQITPSKYAVTAYGILFAANQNGNGSKVIYSMIDDFMTFDPLFYFLINKDDGEDITGMFLFHGDIYITKRHSLHKLLNISDNTNIGDDWITVSKEIGCVDNRSIQELNNSMYWLSENGIVKFDGIGFTLLSTDIKPTIANISEIKSGIKYDVLTTSADFATGTVDFNMSTTTSNGIMITTNPYVNQQNTVSTQYSLLTATMTLYQTFISSVEGYVSSVDYYLKEQNLNVAGSFGIFGGDLSNGTTVSFTVNHTGASAWQSVPFPTVKISSGQTYTLSINIPASVSFTGWYKSVSNNYTRGTMETDDQSALTNVDGLFRVNMILYSTQTYISPIHNVGNGNVTWKQWQAFSYTVSGDNDTKYYIKTSTSNSNLSQHPWVQLSNNAVISSTMGAFYQWYALINSTNNAYSLADVTVSYYASNPSNTLSSGIDIANQRYMLGYTELPSTIPNKVLVWQDRNKSFTMLSGFNPTSMGYYKNDFYIGTLQGKIKRFSYDYTDYDGTSINPYFKTGDFDFNARIMDKYSKELWLSAEPTTIYSTATVDVFLNRSTWAIVSFDYSLVADPYAPNNAIDKKIYKNIGRFTNIAFKIANFVTWNGLDLLYSLEPRR